MPVHSKKIVIVTSGQPTLNPRMVKEADTLAEVGHDVTVLYAYWNSWATAYDETLFPTKKWKAIRVGGDPVKEKGVYFLSRIIHKLSSFLTINIGIKYFSDFAIARSSYFLIRSVKKYSADLYIGHNLGALPAIVKAAKANQKPSGFDAEDFHRHEVTNDENNGDVILKSQVENKYILQVNYFSASSNGIAQAYKNLFPNLTPIVILNTFPADNTIKAPVSATGKTLRMLWFSQTVGSKRGLEDIIRALTILDNPNIELHLLGDLPDTAYLAGIGADGVNLTVHKPLPPERLNGFASRFDLGLALEPGFSINNDLALSNKIFTYMQAGLAIVASDTSAQKELLDAYPTAGRIYQKGDPQMLAKIIDHYFINRDDLLKAKTASYNVARTELNWEKESEKLLGIINGLLQA